MLVRVRAAGVNPLDSKIRDGEFKRILPYRPPFVLGHDVTGVVTRVGPAARGFTVGDEVYAKPDKDRIGTFAELIATNQDDLALKPTSLSMQEAAAVPLVGLTAWQALVEKAKVTAGQKVVQPLLRETADGGVLDSVHWLARDEECRRRVCRAFGRSGTRWAHSLRRCLRAGSSR